MMSKVLRGDRNQCQGCKEYFNSTGAFDKHRTGEFGKNRRCRTSAQMYEIGMALRDDGFWVREKMDVNALLSRHSNSLSDLNGEVIPKLGYDQKTRQIASGRT